MTILLLNENEKGYAPIFAGKDFDDLMTKRSNDVDKWFMKDWKIRTLKSWYERYVDGYGNLYEFVHRDDQ